jgi:predicted transcriptional regulator
LVDKGFVGIKNPNRNNLYYPLVTKSTYSEQSIEGLTERYFEGSYSNVVSFLVDKKQMSIEDLELLLKALKSKLIYLLKLDEVFAQANSLLVFMAF